MEENIYTIRLEEEKDHERVEYVTRDAFWNLSVPGADSHYFAHMLRKHPDFIGELDFVVENDGEIIANIMYHKARLVDENGEEKQIISFGPFSVLPEYQRKGIGKMLLEYSFDEARKMGYDTIAIFGNPDNYVSRGFKSCKKYNVCLEGGVFPCALLVKELTQGTLDGRRWVFYGTNAEDCCNDTAAVEAFDSRFPYRKKEWQPSQEEFYIHSHSAITW